MGLSVEEQRKAQSIRLQPHIANREDRASGCCQGNGNLSCCQNGSIMAKPDANHTDDVKDRNPSSSNGKKKKCTIPTWFKQPERDAFAALAVVAAIASVAGAFFYYRNRR